MMVTSPSVIGPKRSRRNPVVPELSSLAGGAAFPSRPEDMCAAGRSGGTGWSGATRSHAQRHFDASMARMASTGPFPERAPWQASPRPAGQGLSEAAQDRRFRPQSGGRAIAAAVRGPPVADIQRGEIRRPLSVARRRQRSLARQVWPRRPAYPMIAPDYAALRSRLSKEIGPGKRRQRRNELDHGAAKLLGRSRMVR